MIVWNKPNLKEISKRNYTSEQITFLFQATVQIFNSVKPAERGLPEREAHAVLMTEDSKGSIFLNLTSPPM